VPASYRSKGSIGYILPPRCNETVIEEALAIRPPGLAWCFASLAMADFGRDHFARALDAVEDAATQLVDRGVDVIVYSGVPLTAGQGATFHEQLEERLRAQIATVPVVTDSQLIVQALGALGVGRLSVVTPYRAETVLRVRALFESHGFEVVDATGIELSLAQLLTDVDDDSAFLAACASFEAHPETEAFYLSCPQWPVVRAIERLEARTGKPVVTQLQAVLWWTMQVLELSDDVPAMPLGRLMETRLTRPLAGTP
jgi:maleate isomerase